jgi:hypothetical protein
MAGCVLLRGRFHGLFAPQYGHVFALLLTDSPQTRQVVRLGSAMVIFLFWLFSADYPFPSGYPNQPQQAKTEGVESRWAKKKATRRPPILKL